MPEWWNDKTSQADADPLVVGAAVKLTGMDAILAAGASISGNIKGAGSPQVNLKDAFVRASSTTDPSVGAYASTDADGNYTLIGLAAGSYTIEFSANGDENFVRQWWKTSATRDEATPITVSAGQKVTGTNAVLTVGGSITGKVTGGATNAPLEGVDVTAQSASGGYSSATTDASGNYRLDQLAPGDYTVRYDTRQSGLNFVSEWWQDAAFWLDAQVVPVAESEQVTGKDAQLAAGARVSGNVKGVGSPTGALEGVSVFLHSADVTSHNSYWVESDVQGNYEFTGVAAGNYIVGFNAASAGLNYVEQELPVFTVAGGTTISGMDAVLERGGSISGNIKAGSPSTNLADTSVSAFGVDGESWSSAQTDEAGNYTIVGLKPGAHLVSFQHWGDGMVSQAYAPQWWKGSTTRSGATPVTVVADKDAPGHSAVLVQGSGITGTVTDASGTPLPNIQVPVWQKDGSGWTEVAWGWTDSEGVYNVDGLAVGSYKLGFTDVTEGEGPIGDVMSTGSVYEPQYYNAKSSLDSAELVTVTAAGQQLTNKTVALKKKATTLLPLTATPTPTISGTAEIGQILTATAGAWSPQPVALTYQWMRDGIAISGSVAATYAPTAADLGKRISVSATGSKTGYTSVKRTSDLTAAVVDASRTPAPVVDRFAGGDRLSTAVQISERSFDPDVPVVYVATGFAFPDALAAAPAAAAQGGPLLLTTSDTLAKSVSDEIKRLKPKQIVVVGGTSAVSASVYNQLKTLAPAIRRDAGEDRLETSRVIVQKAFPNGAESAYVATAWNFPDALAASAAAGAAAAPVVLVDGTAASVDAKTKSLLTSLKVSKAFIAGGTTVVNTKVEASLKTMLGATKVTRLGGDNRYTTAGVINRASFTQSDTVYLANGLGFADALAGAALAGKNKAPLYTVFAECVPRHVLEDIVSLKATKVVLLGGATALRTEVARLTACS